ncbi:MAG: ferritin-like domain-containing protein [Candidatus Aminicenantes bacterium]|nr:ferritin-like domain-containing protein [Candidatus Aminicenantes bacterium]
MESIKKINNEEDAIKLLNIALEHEWAVSFEYTIHAYSMPKGKYFYEDPIMKIKTDARAQTIQIGIDEMYHALQLGIVIRQMGGEPSFKTDEVIRYPKIMDNLKRDKMTEDLVTNLYQSAEIEEGAFPKIQNMILNISYDEVRHSAQFASMMDTLKAEGQEEILCYQSNPEVAAREEVSLLHAIMTTENELMHRYLYYTIMFSEHQDLSQRLFKNSIDHMRHWDKNSGILIKLGDVVRIENAVKDAAGVEKSRQAMPDLYPGDNRKNALETLIPAEEKLVADYEKLISMISEEEIKKQLELHLASKREHVFTQQWLLKNAQKVSGIL